MFHNIDLIHKLLIDNVCQCIHELFALQFDEGELMEAVIDEELVNGVGWGEVSLREICEKGGEGKFGKDAP